MLIYSLSFEFTIVVTNAHGVCGNCGEVAFQCRKCRHINYDRLDAFLCVECGYCASGSFSYELTAGVASNAVTITSDNDRERSMKMLGSVISIENEIRSAILEKVAIIGRKKAAAKNEESSALSSYSIQHQHQHENFNSAMKMAFMGIPSSASNTTTSSTTTNQDALIVGGVAAGGIMKVLDRLDKPGSVVQYVARPNSLPIPLRSVASAAAASSSADRTRSLLRLARQMRNESGYPSTAADRNRRDVLIRQLGRGLAIDHMEDDGDLLGLLEGDGLDSSIDPIGRALAASSRRRLGGGMGMDIDVGGDMARTEGVGGATAATTAAAATSAALKKKETNNETATEFLRLHSLMREAEREKNELTRRLQAWDGLNRGSLGYLPSSASSLAAATTSQEVQFAPSHCSTCSVPVAQQLLTLWLRLFQASPFTVAVDLDFICTLLEDMPGIGKGFLESKRMVVCEIATKSPMGAKLVLHELKTRLSVAKDMNCAEILGKILEVEDFEFAEEFSRLAMDVLARSQ